MSDDNFKKALQYVDMYLRGNTEEKDVHKELIDKVIEAKGNLEYPLEELEKLRKNYIFKARLTANLAAKDYTHEESDQIIKKFFEPLPEPEVSDEDDDLELIKTKKIYFE